MDRSLFRDRLLAVGLAAAGIVLAMLAVYVGTGPHDGFGDWEPHRLGRRLRRYFPYALLLAAGIGLILHSYCAAVMRSTPAPWTLLISIPRAFAHFTLFGFVVLLAFVGLLAWQGLAWLARKLRGAQDPAGLSSGKRAHERIICSGIVLTLWFMWFPVAVMSGGRAVGEIEGDSKLAEDITRSFRQPGLKTLQRRMFALLPWLVACVFLWVGAESEDTANRVDPYWLTAVAGFWFADYLVVAFRVVPALRARREAGA